MANKLETSERRRKNYWEPIYAPKPTQKFELGDWDFEHKDSVVKCIYRVPNNTTIRQNLKNIKFNECDFSEDYSQMDIAFDSCTFYKCDFGRSRWKRVKFRNCTFQLTSLTVCKFENCEFRDCTFDKIGISGNETQLPNTLITNPRSFIEAAYTNLEYLPKDVKQFHQKNRLIQTQSTLARVILANIASEGSETTYYDAVSTATIYGTKARASEAKLENSDKLDNSFFSSVPRAPIRSLFSALKIVGSNVDLIFLRIIGISNSWGRSISRI